MPAGEQSCESRQQIRRLERWHEGAVVVDEDQYVEPAEEDRVDMEKVVGDDAVGLGTEEPGAGRP